MKNLIAFLLLTVSINLSASDIWMVVNSSSEINNLDNDTISSLYLGRTSSSDGVAIRVVSYKTEESFVKTFLRELAGKTPSQFKALWMRLVFTGKAKPLMEVKDHNEMIEVVMDNESALGFVSTPIESEKLKFWKVSF